ncbi:hypothetical protein RUM43_002735 [Polyplax serrata]|uniref:Uncharacterized protein n=1 Tax=Polyplax serrata TaxID=468196 RepID=A0AAN8PD85_POLSC
MESITSVHARLREPIVSCPPQGPRSTSQNTYVVPETPRSPVEIRPTRKISVLLDYDGGGQKKQTATHTEQVQSGHGTQQEKNRKVMESVGRVRKVSLLDDFKVPNFVKSIEKNSDDAEKENFQVDTAAKAIKRTSLGAKKITGTKLSTLKAKKGETSEKTNTLTVGQQEPTDENVPKKENGGEEKEDLTKNTEKLILDLENILREKPVDSLKKEKDGSAKPSKRPLPVSEKPLNIAKPEKKKRNIDTKIVQEFMKNQKLKRQEEIKTSKKSKIEEREAIKKKLEELRLKTLKLAAQSKKKKVPESAIKIVEQPTEEDITMSLGLKQVKPKVSYNESISNLRKKPSQVKVKATNPEIRVGGDAEEAEEEQEINVKVDVEEESVKIISEAPQLVKPPTDSVALDMKAHSDLNATLKKLAETLHFKIEEKERQLKSRPTSVTSKSVKDPLSRVISEESIRTRSDTHDHRKMITIDLETIHALKEDIKRISENFKVLHEIIVEKADLNDNKAGKKTETNEPVGERQQEKEQERSQNDPCQQQSEEVPLWVQSGFPRPHPYNVYTAFRQKMNLQTSHSSTSVTSRETSPYAGTLSNKYDSEFETLSLPSDRLRSSKQMFQKSSSKKLVTSNVAATNENPNSYNDSGSELSSSIFDYEKQILTSVKTKSTTSIVTCRSNSQESTTSTAISEVISNNHHVGSPDKSLSSRLVPEVDLRQERENLILVTPDVKLITNQVADKKLNGFEKNLNTNQGKSSPKMSFSLRSNDELNNSEDKSVRESKTESTITEIIDNLSEIDKSSRTVKPNKKVQNIVQKVEEPQNVTRRTFFQPEMLHLQFQAELSLLETFQQSLSHFLEAERKKTLSEVTKIVYEKSVNTEKALEREDQGVQTTFIKEDFPQNSPNGKTETDMIVTEVEDEKSNDDAEDLKSVMTEKSISSKIELDHETEDKMGEISEKISLSTNSAEESEKESEHRGSARRAPETPDFSTGHNVISFQMLNRMIKDEELRSEHQLALIRLREKTLNEKVKAELTFLEMRKRALKEGGGSDGEQNVSAIKKKQRGILLKYQSEKEEIERLKKMHKIASEERNIMMKQQKQIQQMQLSTKDMLIKLRKREKSPLKKSPVKSKVFKSFSTQSEIQDVALDLSDSILTESAYSIEESIRQSNDSDMEISSDYNECNTGNDKISRGNRKRKENRVTGDFESPVKMKQSVVKAEKHPEGRHSVEELVTWTKLLEEKENRLKELEKQTIKTANKAKSRLLKTSKNLKSCMKDRSTSPFHFPDNFNALTEKSSSINEMIVTKTSSTLSEDIPESILKMETSEMNKYVDKVQNSISEDIPVQFSKAEVNGSESRTMEYYTESFESPSLSEAHKVKIINAHSKSMGSEAGCRSIPIKLSLSPRIQSPRRRNSSGSDDSINLSHTETASEQSDLESRIAALHEQLRKRKLEAERLRREQKKAQRERLKVKEQSLLKQIQAYDAYIEKKKMELEQEYDHSVHAISKPLIKQPKVAEKSSVKKQEPLLMNYARVSVKAKTKEDSSPTESGRATESVNEIVEQIKVSSESIKEDIRTSGSIQEELSSSKDPIQSQIEDLCEAEVKDVTSTVEVDTSLIEASEIAKESSESPGSKPKTELVPDASLSESDDQSASIKTTLHSPEKQDTDAGETKEMTEVIEEGSIEKEHAGDSTYLSDSFESDADEKSLANESKTQQVCDVSPTETNIVSDLTDQQSVTPEKQEETVTPEEYVQVKTDASVEDDVKEGDTSSVSEVLEQQIQVEEDESKKAKAESISDYIILDLLKESLKTYAVKKDEVERKLSESTKMSQANLADDLSRGIITEGIEDMLKVYGRKTKRKEDEAVEESISPERITTDIRKRICEIMSHSSGVKDQRRPQDMMVTTYDVTPRSSPPPPEEEITSFNEKEEFLRSLISPSNKDKTEGHAELKVAGDVLELFPLPRPPV